MTKLEFLDALRQALSGLTSDDRERYIDYYAEMIDDRIEDGMSEESAVEQVGAIDEIAAAILAEIDPIKPEKTTKTKRRMRGWEIALLILGSPLWISLLAAAVSIALAVAIVIFAIYLVIWVVLLVLWVTDLALGLSAIAGLCGSIVMLIRGYLPQGLFLLGCSLACGGIKIAWIFGCCYATKYIWRFTKWTVRKLIRKRGKRA